MMIGGNYGATALLRALHSGRPLTAEISKWWPLSWVVVFCFQNDSDILWGKIVLLNWEKFGAEDQELAKILRSLEQFIQRVKGQNNLF